jgi:hypothetical protein
MAKSTNFYASYDGDVIVHYEEDGRVFMVGSAEKPSRARSRSENYIV